MENRRYNPKLKGKGNQGSKQMLTDEAGSSSGLGGMGMQKPGFESAQQERLKRMKRRMEMKVQKEEQMDKELEALNNRAKGVEFPVANHITNDNDKDKNPNSAKIEELNSNIQVSTSPPNTELCFTSTDLGDPMDEQSTILETSSENISNECQDAGLALKTETVITTMEDVQLNMNDGTCSSPSKCEYIETNDLSKPVESGNTSVQTEDVSTSVVPAEKVQASVATAQLDVIADNDLNTTAQSEFDELPIDLPNAGEDAPNSSQDDSPESPKTDGWEGPLETETTNSQVNISFEAAGNYMAEAQNELPKVIESGYSSPDEPSAAKNTKYETNYVRPAPVVYGLRTANSSESDDSSSSDESSAEDEPVRKSPLVLPPVPEGFNFNDLSPTSQFIMTISQFPHITTVVPPSAPETIQTPDPVVSASNKPESESDADSDAMEIDESGQSPLQDVVIMETNDTIQSYLQRFALAMGSDGAFQPPPQRDLMEIDETSESCLPRAAMETDVTIKASRGPSPRQLEQRVKRIGKKRSPSEKKKKQKLLTDLHSAGHDAVQVQWDIDTEIKYLEYIKNALFNINEQRAMWKRLQKFQVWTIDLPLSLHVPGGPCCSLSPKRVECQVIRRAKRCFLSRARVVYKWVFPHMARNERKLRQILDDMWNDLPVKHKETIYFDKCGLFYHKVISIVLKFPPGPFERDVFNLYFPKGIPTARSRPISTTKASEDDEKLNQNSGAEAFDPNFSGFPGIPTQVHWTETLQNTFQHLIA